MNSLSTINVIDIGSSKVQCLITQPNLDNGELEVIGYAHRESSTHLLNQGNIVNIDKTAKIIREVVASAEMMAGVEVGDIFTNIPGILCHGISSHGLIAVTPKEGGEKKVTLSDLERVIDIAESTPIPRDHIIIHSVPVEFKVDGIRVEEDPLGMVGMRLETQVYLLTCPKGTLDNLHKVVQTAGYELRDIMSESITFVEAVLSEEEKKLGSLVIDIGSQFTNAILYSENGVHLSFAIPLGGDSLTRDLSVGINTGLTEAEEIKKQHGVLDYKMVDEDKMITVKLIAYQKKTHISQRAVFQIIEARMIEILDLIKKELKNRQATFPVGCGIVITGGGAIMPGIDTIVRNVFNLSVRVGYPLGVKGLDSQVISPNYSTSLGMAHIVSSRDTMSGKGKISTKDGILKRIESSIKNFFT